MNGQVSRTSIPIPLPLQPLRLQLLCLYIPSGLTLIDKAFKYISVDRSKKPYQVTMAMGTRPDAKGEIDETNELVHTGYINFPDDRRYSFWYYTKEGTIYWDKDKGPSKWTSVMSKLHLHMVFELITSSR